MKLFNITGVTESQKEIVRTSLQGLRIKIEGNSSLNEFITIVKKDKQGQVIFSNKLPILKLAILSDDGEGANHALRDTESTDRSVTNLFLKLSEEGNISNEDHTFLEITLHNLSSAVKYDVFSTESLVESNGAIIYSEYSVTGQQNRLSINVSKYSSCIVPTEELQELSILYTNGKTVDYSREEIIMLSKHLNDNVFIVKNQAGLLLHEDIILAPDISCKLTLTGASKIFFTGEMSEPFYFEEWQEATIIKS